MVERDSTDPPADGVYGVCYINGFQTQPGAVWPSSLLVRRRNGQLLVDPGWPGEHLFNLAKAKTRAAVLARLKPVIRHCATAGYQAVEFDNLDSWTRARGAFGKTQAVAFATALVAAAHASGLAAAQKNTTQLGDAGRRSIGYDFAIAEQCDRYRECDTYTAAYGALVYDIEYAGDLRGTAAEVCSRTSQMVPAPSVIVRDLELVPSDHHGYTYTAC